MSGDEEDKDEEEELTHDDDEQDVDEINHTQLSKETVRTHSPITRTRRFTVIHRVQKLQSNRTHHQERMGSVSSESVGSTMSGRH